MPTAPRPVRRIITPLAEFLQTESAGGIVLFGAAVVALLWANVAPAAYDDLWSQHLTIGPVDEDLHHWVNDGLMAIFFFVVGLEIKRELVTGELRDPRTAALPAIAALGGMIVPGVIYVAWTMGTADVDGWGIPMATDIAFAIGVLTLLGSRVPSPLKLFLLTLAIVDDVGAILVIAIFYSEDLAGSWLGAGAAMVGVVLLLRRLRVRSPLAYVIPGVALWYCLLESGVHATLAGVILGLLTPAVWPGGDAPIERLEHLLHPVSSFVIIPLFALANAGIELGASDITNALETRVTWAILTGLVIGKFLGVAGAAWLATRFGPAQLPDGVGWRHLCGAATLAGIGFTVSLFIANLSFDDSAATLADAKIAILSASLLSGIVGAIVLSRRSLRSG